MNYQHEWIIIDIDHLPNIGELSDALPEQRTTPIEKYDAAETEHWSFRRRTIIAVQLVAIEQRGAVELQYRNSGKERYLQIDNTDMSYFAAFANEEEASETIDTVSCFVVAVPRALLDDLIKQTGETAQQLLKDVRYEYVIGDAEAAKRRLLEITGYSDDGSATNTDDDDFYKRSLTERLKQWYNHDRH